MSKATRGRRHKQTRDQKRKQATAAAPTQAPVAGEFQAATVIAASPPVVAPQTTADSAVRRTLKSSRLPIASSGVAGSFEAVCAASCSEKTLRAGFKLGKHGAVQDVQIAADGLISASVTGGWRQNYGLTLRLPLLEGAFRDEILAAIAAACSPHALAHGTMTSGLGPVALDLLDEIQYTGIAADCGCGHRTNIHDDDPRQGDSSDAASRRNGHWCDILPRSALS